jgi:diguanylate cyclase
LTKEVLDAVFINIMVMIAFTAVMGEILKYSILNSSLNKKSRTYSVKARFLITAVLVIESITLMHFSIPIDSRFSIDFRLIPIIIIAMYVGMMPAVIAATVLLIIRVGVHGFSVQMGYTFFAMIIIAVVCGAIAKLKIAFPRKSLYIFICVSLVINIATLVLSKSISMSVKAVPYLTIITLLLYISIYKGINYISSTNNTLIRLKEEANRDFLTGLYNSRFYNIALEDLSNLLREKEEIFSLIYVDIDNFKDINDKYGHGAGDYVIKEISLILSKACRKYDVVSRIGGDEFTALLPNCPEEKASEVAERIRKIINTHKFTVKNGQIITITASIGVKSCTNSKKSIEEIKEEVDKALYRAKRCGRNTVCTV